MHAAVAARGRSRAPELLDAEEHSRNSDYAEPGLVELTGPKSRSTGAQLPDGRGGTNVEAIAYTDEMGFDKERSLEAFKDTVYPLTRAYCDGCHNGHGRLPRRASPGDEIELIRRRAVFL